MAQGKKLNDKKIEEIKAVFLATNNVSETSRRCGVAKSTVGKFIKDNEDEFNKLRNEKKQEYIEEAWNTITLYISHVQKPEVVNKTNARDSAILIGTLWDKIHKREELDIKREEVNLKKKEIELKEKTPQVDVSLYVDALKGSMKEVWNE